jgi:hypothetical protein
VGEWTSILTLAIQWDFQSVKTLAANRLSFIASPIEKIVLGRRFDMFEWLQDGYTAVCSRHEALTIEEGNLLGIEDVVKIAAVRQGKKGSSYTRTNNVLREVFKLHGLVPACNPGTKEKQDGSRGPPGKSIKKGKGKRRRHFVSEDYDGI